MYHERQAGLHGPAHLLLESLKLLALVLAAPVIVEPHLAYRYETAGELPPHLGKHVAEVGAHLLGVKPCHGVGKARVAVARGQDAGYRWQVDGRHQHMTDACGLGAGHDLIAVGVKLWTVEMRVCVDVVHNQISIIIHSR